MKSKLAICSILFLASCVSTKTIAVKGSYLQRPFEVISENSKDAVWDKLIDLFAQKGLSIKIIDRSSGLIISEETALLWSWEDAKGTAQKREAWVVIPKVIDIANKKPIKPYRVTGEWNVRIKQNSEGKTVINVNLVNFKAIENPRTTLYPQTALTGAQSTGIFEKIIADSIQ